MHRFMADPSNIHNGTITLVGEDLKHLRQVLRLKPGDVIYVFDGSGKEYEATILTIEKSSATARIDSVFQADTEPRIRVTLFQGLPKNEKMELIIQKAVELGVYRIVPVITQRSVVQLDAKDRERKAERWARIAREAAKQCRRAYVPSISHPLDFEEVLDYRSQFGAALLLYENESKKCLKERLKCYTIKKIEDIALFVGPEGGFDDQEVVKCIETGFDVTGLGKRILRTETAAISVLSIIMYEMGEMD